MNNTARKVMIRKISKSLNCTVGETKEIICLIAEDLEHSKQMVGENK